MRMKTTNRAFVVGGATAALTALAACGRVPDNPPPECSVTACTVDEGDRLHTVVDASDRDLWVYFDFETSSDVVIEDPADSVDWDVAFKRMVVKSNGGVNGNGNVQGAIVDDVAFEDVDVAPTGGWMVDKAGDEGERDPGGTIFNEDAWYAYDLITHTLEPVPDRVYVIRTVEGNAFKVRMDGYYNLDAAAGFPSFTWSAIANF